MGFLKRLYKPDYLVKTILNHKSKHEQDGAGDNYTKE